MLVHKKREQFLKKILASHIASQMYIYLWKEVL